jgi:DNA-binding NtrC family response regulator
MVSRTGKATRPRNRPCSRDQAARLLAPTRVHLGRRPPNGLAVQHFKSPRPRGRTQLTFALDREYGLRRFAPMLWRKVGQGVGGVERLRIGVIDRSPSIRETAAIVLHEHDVARFAPEEFLRLDQPFAGDLLLVERGCLTTEELTRLAPGVPVVWLESAPLEANAAHFGALPRPFRPQELRRWVRTFASGLQRERLELATLLPSFPPPLLPAAAIPTVRAALRTQLPLVIYGEQGTGKLRLARALHAASGNHVHVKVPGTNCDVHLAEKLRGYPPKTRITLCVTAFEQLAPGGEELLADLLLQSQEQQTHLWFLACTTVSPEMLAETEERFGAILHHAAVFTVRLPALRDRTEDLPAIISAEGARIAAMLRSSPPTFTPEAWERLLHYLWFGNLPELEAVLARTMTLVRERPIPAHALLFAPPGQSTTAQGTTKARNFAPPSTEAKQLPSLSTTQQLEVLLHELAHELKNPLVTIKTISQHLERLLGDETGREQVAQLAGEAVDRMDRILDNLLRFARYGTPTLQKTSVNAVLAPALAELASVLSEKQIVLHYLPPEGAWIQGDPAQLTFALENLLRAVVRDLEEGSTLSIEPLVGSTGIEIRFPRSQGAVVERLRRFVDEEGPGSSPLEPLGFLIARSLLERNRATLREQSEDARCTLTILFPPATGTEETYAETSRFNRG